MSAPANKPPSPRLFRTLRSDVGHVTADVMRRGLWRQFSGTLGELESFYLSDDARARLAAMPAISRWAHRAWWLLTSLLMKLTPARRVLLALGLFMLVWGDYTINYSNVHLTFNLPGFGNLCIFLVLMLELKDKLIARDELEAGRKVQLALMPRQNPDVPGWDIWMHTEPANDVGGDLVDYLRVDDRHHGVALGDVAGKALPAALLMVKLQATLRALIPEFDTLSALGAGVNRIIERDGLTNRFATLVYLVLTADSGEVRLLNAGHLPPLVVRQGSLEEMPRGSMALGIMAEATFDEQQVALASGDVLVVYSDGVTEAINASGDFFGDDRLRRAILSKASQPAAAVGAGILQALEDFVGLTKPFDDVSVVVLKKT